MFQTFVLTVDKSVAQTRWLQKINLTSTFVSFFLLLDRAKRFHAPGTCVMCMYVHDEG